MTRPLTVAEHSAYLRTKAALELVRDERRRQDGLVTAGKFRWTCAELGVDEGYKLAVLGEEYGEVCRVLCEAITARQAPDVEHLREELVQVAAVAVAWLEALE